MKNSGVFFTLVPTLLQLSGVNPCLFSHPSHFHEAKAVKKVFKLDALSPKMFFPIDGLHCLLMPDLPLLPDYFQSCQKLNKIERNGNKLLFVGCCVSLPHEGIVKHVV